MTAVDAIKILSLITCGWSASPNSLICSPDINGGIIDRAADGTWFIIFHREIPSIDDLDSLEDAVEMFCTVIRKHLKAG